MGQRRNAQSQRWGTLAIDGRLCARLESGARELGWSSVKFLGFKNQSELPRYYDLCDAFVLPSEFEAWGLVINEVMNAGKAVIVSDRVGAARDLVIDGDNGFVFPAGDVGSLAQCLRRLTDNAALTKTMGEASLRRIESWDFEADLQGVMQALDATVGKPTANRTNHLDKRLAQ